MGKGRTPKSSKGGCGSASDEISTSKSPVRVKQEQFENSVDSSEDLFATQTKPVKSKKSKNRRSSPRKSSSFVEFSDVHVKQEQFENSVDSSEDLFATPMRPVKSKKSKNRRSSRSFVEFSDNDSEAANTSILLRPRDLHLPNHEMSESDEDMNTDLELHNIAKNIRTNLTPSSKSPSKRTNVGRSPIIQSKSPTKSRKRSYVNDDAVSRSSPKQARKRASHLGKVGPIGMRYDAPDHFEQVKVAAGAPVWQEDLQSEDVQLYLCQLPHDMVVEQLTGEALEIDGGSVVCTKALAGAKKKRLEIHVRNLTDQQTRGQLTVLAPSLDDGHLHPVQKRLCGQLTVTESPVPDPYVLPPPRPKISRELPPGLKQRYIPFGANQPVVSSPLKKKKKKRKSQNIE